MPVMRLAARLSATLGLWLFLASAPGAERPIPNAHAHNDYEHPHPLWDALEHGFGSVEADIHLVEGELLVAHDLDQVRRSRTLQALYLDPLLERVRQNQGRVHPEAAEFILLIDVKSEANETYRVLRRVLEPYREMLTRFSTDGITPGGVTAIISGNRPRELMEQEKVRYAAVDGRLDDLDRDPPLELVPLVSDNWRRLFEWRGEGEFPESERRKLRELVTRAHQQGRRIRFWASPDQPASWLEQCRAGVDLINTDRLADLREFLLSNRCEGRTAHER